MSDASDRERRRLASERELFWDWLSLTTPLPAADGEVGASRFNGRSIDHPSPTAVPQPIDVPRSVLVSVENKPATWTIVNPVRLVVVVVVENVDAIDAPMLSILLHERIEVLPVSYFETATGAKSGPMASSGSKQVRA